MTLDKWLLSTALIVGLLCSKGSLANEVLESGGFEEMSLLKRSFPAACDKVTEDDCPGGVALLLAGNLADKNSVQRCSSFLIDSQTLVTNRHCIPNEVREGVISCKKRLVAFFPKTPQFPEEQVGCEEVLRLSGEGDANFSSGEQDLSANWPDFTVLRLSRPLSRSFFKISRRGLPNGITLTAFTFDPLSSDPFKAILRKKNCESIQNTDLLPSYRDPWSPVASFKGCPIVPGNSGSVVIDSSGSIRAFVQAMWPLESALEDSQAPLAPFSLMTNAACLPLSEDFQPRDPRCDRLRPLHIDFKHLYADGESYNFESEFQEFLKSHESPFEFKMKRVSIQDRMVTTPEITCIRKSAFEVSSKVSEKQRTYYISLPLWGPTKKVTSEYRYKVVPARITLMFTSIQLDVTQLLREGHTLAREIRSSFFTYSDEEIPLSLCPE